MQILKFLEPKGATVENYGPKAENYGPHVLEIEKDLHPANRVSEYCPRGG